MTPGVLDTMGLLLLDLGIPMASVRSLGSGSMDSGRVVLVSVFVSVSAVCSAVVGMCHMGTEVDLLWRLLVVVELGRYWRSD